MYTFLHKVQGTVNTIDEIGGNAREMISDGNSSLRSGDFVRVGDERTSPTSYARTFKCAGLMIGEALFRPLRAFSRTKGSTANEST